MATSTAAARKLVEEVRSFALGLPTPAQTWTRSF
jgi:hypothetical protein